MRLGVRFELESSVMVMEYRKGIISYLKKALQTYDEEFYRKMYESTVMKPFTFSTYLPIEKVVGEHLKLKEPFMFLNLSTHDMTIGVHLYNALLGMKDQKFNLSGTVISLKKIHSQKEKTAIRNQITIRLLSPLVVRDHNRETNGDRYVTLDDGDFHDVFRRNLTTQLETFGVCNPAYANLFTLKAIDSKKEVIRYYDQLIDGMRGVFSIEAPLDVIQHVYQSGMGSRRSAGFGMIDIL